MTAGFAEAWRAALAGAAARRLAATRGRMRANARSGSAMIEFAMIAPIFFVLLFGILETGIMFYGQFELQNATATAARLIRTGAAQETDYTTAAKCSGSNVSGAYTSSQQWFTDQICCGISNILSCDKLQVDVETSATGFTGANFPDVLDASGNIKPGNDNYEPGDACDVVLVRSFYSWPVLTPLLSFFLVNMANNSHLLVATAAFRNEPFSAGVAGC